MSDPVAQLAEAVASAASSLSDKPVEVPALERPPKPEFGDYSTNAAMLLAPALGEPPRQIAERLGEALTDQLAGDVEAKCKAITRALRIVDEGLKAPLDAAGGALSDNLRALYGYVTLRLTQANLGNDPAALDECVKLLEPVRAAWLAIAPPTPVAAEAQ